jgi:hypothetical protein
MCWPAKKFTGFIAGYFDGHDHAGLSRCQGLPVGPVNRDGKVSGLGGLHKVTAADHERVRSWWVRAASPLWIRAVQGDESRVLVVPHTAHLLP